MAIKRKIAYLSSHFSGLVKLEYLYSHDFEIDTLITIDPEQAVKNNVAGYVDFNDFAVKKGIQIYYAKKFSLKDSADYHFFSDNNFDLLVISGWQRLVPEEILKTLTNGAIAEHGSADFLPKGRGRSPINWSIIEGQERFVIHIFKADADADSGKIIDYYIFQINDFDNVKTVYYKAAICSAKLLLRNLGMIFSNKPIYKEESPELPSYYSKRNEADDFLNWSLPTECLYNHIRATTNPYPLAKAKINNRIIRIIEAVPFDFCIDFFSEPHRSILAIFPDRSFIVKTVDGSLFVKQYRFEGQLEVGMIFDE